MTAPSIDAVSGLRARIGEVFDGELHLSEEEATRLLDALEAQARELAEAREEIAKLRGAEFAAKRRAATDEAMWRDAFKTAMKNGDRMLAAQTRIAALEDAVRVKDEALVDHNDMLRSAFTASQRDAVFEIRGTTAYNLIADRMSDVLTKHHAVTNRARSVLSREKEAAR